MKKVLVFLSFCFIYFSVIAEQPFFLKNWIIPEDVQWGTSDRIPKIEGKVFSQTSYDGDPLTYFFMQHKDSSNLDVPPYFSQNKLFDWDMTYSQIFSAFEKNSDFEIYDSITASGGFSTFYEGYIKFTHSLTIIHEKFCMTITFPHYDDSENQNSALPVSFTIGYSEKGYESAPEIEFEKNNSKKWNSFSEQEKNIIALTSPFIWRFDFDHYDFDAINIKSEQYKNAKEFLKGKNGVNSKKDLLALLEKTENAEIVNSYHRLLELSISEPDKNPVEIGLEHKLSPEDITILFPVRDMAERIGKNEISLLNDVYALMYLRLGIGAGYISKKEAFNLSVPYVNRLLSNYSSYEDFYAHCIAAESFCGMKLQLYSEYAMTFLMLYYKIYKVIPSAEIKFNGTNADTPLKIEKSFYNPTNDSPDKVWMKVRALDQFGMDERGLFVIQNYINTFGEKTLVKDLYKSISLRDIDQINQIGDFFEKNYRKYWDSLDDFAKYAILFSSNLFELNDQFHFDFGNRIGYSNSSSGKNLLKNSWNITDYESLIENFNQLETYGHHGSYNDLLGLLEKYPGKTPLEICTKECLDVLSVTRLYFIQNMKDYLGKHGLEAWDEGRQITIMRWGIGAGYISEEEARTLLAPVVKRIRENYVDLEDYFSHYIAGRCYFGLYDSTYESLGFEAYEELNDAMEIIPDEELTFTGINADKKHPMKYKDCIYHPSSEVLEWETLQNLNYKKQTNEVLNELIKYEAEHSEVKDIVFCWHLNMLCLLNKPHKEIIEYIESELDYVNSWDPQNSPYYSAISIYLISLNGEGRHKECIEYFENLPDLAKNYGTIFYQYGIAYYSLAQKTDNEIEREIYKERANYVFKILVENDINIGETLENWLYYGK